MTFLRVKVGCGQNNTHGEGMSTMGTLNYIKHSEALKPVWSSNRCAVTKSGFFLTNDFLVSLKLAKRWLKKLFFFLNYQDFDITVHEIKACPFALKVVELRSWKVTFNLIETCVHTDFWSFFSSFIIHLLFAMWPKSRWSTSPRHCTHLQIGQTKVSMRAQDVGMWKNLNESAILYKPILIFFSL